MLLCITSHAVTSETVMVLITELFTFKIEEHTEIAFNIQNRIPTPKKNCDLHTWLKYIPTVKFL